MRKLVKAKNEEKQQEQFVTFKENLMKVFEDPYEKIALDYFDFILWLDSKITKQSFVKLAMEKSDSK